MSIPRPSWDDWFAFLEDERQREEERRLVEYDAQTPESLSTSCGPGNHTISMVPVCFACGSIFQADGGS